MYNYNIFLESIFYSISCVKFSLNYFIYSEIRLSEIFVKCKCRIYNVGQTIPA